MRRVLLISFICCPWLSPVLASEWKLEDARLQQCVDVIANMKGIQSVEGIREVRCNNKKIQSIKGIEVFTNLTTLSLYKNQLKKVDISGFLHLQRLNLAGNKLQNLTIADMPNLTELYVFKNKLKTLSISQAPKLQKLKANNNKLASAKFVDVGELKKIYFFDNKLEQLNMDSMPGLVYLDARQNPMPDEFYDLLDGIDSLTALHDGNAEDWQ